MYDQFYGFTGRPFQLTPDPHFYFESGTHRKAMSYLGYGLAQGEGFIVITGDVGAGKTTLVGHLMNTIDPNRLTAVKLVSTQVEGDDLLRLVAEQFGLEWEGQSKAELLRSMEQYLREQARAGKRTLLIVDEGQNLAISALEELRMLSNFQLGGHSLLQIFLLGQPEFRQTLFHSPTLEQLRQRVIATHHLDPMEPEEVEPYILHRLSKVGWTGNPSFSPDAFEEIFDYSEGVPRKLNVLVSRLLLYGAVEQMTRITAQNVRSVVGEIEADRGIDASTLAPLPVDDVVAAAAVAVAPTSAPFAAPTPANETALEWPQRAAEPAADGRGPFAVPADPADAVMLTPPDPSADEILERMAAAKSEASASLAIDPEQLAALEAQITSLETRLVEQDAALRRVLDLLIEWVERDPENAPNPATSRTWAA
ncbi:MULTISPECIES: XrtA/PEP-CTERM system-associated ATPase [unclassified Sphingopyxis]|jgi:general secretion pathway protein A|uniref:XrtA/PEP-CTERM system-associated ATPase n=1 Tax=unclassified Sphingopyxis TaxID=2614943 RepID=UPI00286570EF|nr:MULTISPECIES: XrtA/PEP-CTERM system-associated ATPase [unclassified Sphingopyxis]MDR6832369.1 putative secretion ATPase (PEP-CTERM system associated) [Sphingopyxis sp. BE122]MDR7228112.1 putative secretion ATPase (PEP-CTERM system associated) [Sphingopyxis sp. BE259]